MALYLIASVLLSFYCTLGITFAFFWALDPAGFAGLDWKVPIFLFTILMAIGADYNIFLMTRIHEEQENQDAVSAVASAMVKTGRIITSCGLIMAGTFASLITGSLTDLKQLGFALALGVLVDTFVVRPILVPAFLILLNRSHGVGPNQSLRSARIMVGGQMPQTQPSNTNQEDGDTADQHPRVHPEGESSDREHVYDPRVGDDLATGKHH